MFEMTPYTHTNRYSSDPFRAMEEFENNFFGRQNAAFKTDIRENENSYVLEAELPGFNKEEISAEVKGGYLTIHAEHTTNEENKENGKYVRRERSYSSYSRSFDLDGIDEESITAAYKDGILTLTLPKAQTKLPEARKLEII